MFKKITTCAAVAVVIAGMSAPASASWSFPGSSHALLNGTVDYLCPKSVSIFSFARWMPCFD